MDDSIKTYKCPNCGAALTFDSKTQKLHCSHCDTSIDVEAMKALSDTPSGTDQDNARWNTSDAGSNWSSGEQQGMRSYHCLHVVQNLSLMRQQLLLPVPTVVLLSYCLTI